jgi:hypothetical protein
LNEAEIDDSTPQRKGRRRWIVWFGAAILVVAIAAAIGVRWALQQVQPLLRKKVVETLSARFHSPVELDRLDLSLRRGVVVTGGGLRILYLTGPVKANAQPHEPMLTVDSFEFVTGWRELLRPTTRLVIVKVQGLHVNIPPKGERGAGLESSKQWAQPKWGFIVDTIECTDAKVTLETNNPEKKPLVFDISRLKLTDVGPRSPLKYEAVLVNPKPVGDVVSTGSFGPWQGDEPRDTPLSGNYSFTHADLSSIHGIGGVLASTGQFDGTLGSIVVDGVADVPQFRLDVSDHGLPLHVEFHAIVDGTNGDTRLDPVKGQFARSWFTATGSVTRDTEVPGHTTDLHVVMEKGRLEDAMTLALKANPPLMRGSLTTKAHIVVPPGPVSVSRKMRVDGTFSITEAMFNDPQMQAKLDSLSMRAQGKPKLANAQAAEVVGSSLSGTVALANAVMQVPEVNFGMPGGQLKMNGHFDLVPSTFEFHGVVRTEATASQMTTGWKSLLLSPFDKLLKKNGAGVELPIKVTGTRSTYDLRLDFPHDTRAPASLPPPK